MKSRLDEVAKLAGVGSATVDRVLNERGGVSPKTALKVLQAARQLDIGRILPSPHRRLLRVKVITPLYRTTLLHRFSKAFEYQIGLNAKTLVIERVTFDPLDLSEAPAQILDGKADALIIFAPETSGVIDAIASATSSGVPVVTVGSDLPTTPRLAYVGIDHYRAGHAAGFFMARMAGPKRFVVVCSDLKYRAEGARISGFRDGVRAEFSVHPDIEVIDSLAWSRERYDDSYGGLYVAGSKVPLYDGLGSGTPGNLMVIAHDLGAELSELMPRGAVTIAIDQDPEEQAARAIAVILSRFGIVPSSHAGMGVPFTIHTRHNI